jgi:hypothetical protein
VWKRLQSSFHHFKGNKSEVLAFIGNVDTAFSVIISNQEDILWEFFDPRKWRAKNGNPN